MDLTDDYFAWLNIMHCLLYGIHPMEFEDEVTM